jgi:hypothetical protein
LIFSGKAGDFIAKLANLIGKIRGIDYAPVKFELVDDLTYRSAEILRKVLTKAECSQGL